MSNKDSVISPRLVEDFYTKDRGKISFWIARAEKYDKDRVFKSCIRAGANEEVANGIARDVDRLVDNRMKMSDVRPLIFALLQKRAPEAARRFSAGDVYVRTSAEVFEKFNRKRITDSLVKETGLDEERADRVAHETEKFLKSINVSFMSSQLIREIVNAKLLEHGMEKERLQYTRIGLPVFDITKMINMGTKENANLQYNPETIHKLMADHMSREYALTKVLNPKLSEAHLEGQIHIHDLDYFCTRPFCFSHDVRFFLKRGFKPDGTGNHTSIAGPARKPEVAILHAAKVLAASQVNCAGGQGFSYFNTFIAPLVRGLEYKKIKQLAQMYIYEMSQMYIARGGQSLHENDTVWIGNYMGFEPAEIGEFVDNLLEKNKNHILKAEDMEILKTSDIKTISLDPETMQFKEFEVTGVSRHRPRDKDLYEIKTKSGKGVRVTDFHSIYTIKNKKIAKVKASELREGDFVLVPKKLSIDTSDVEVDIIDILKKNAPDKILKNIYVRTDKGKIPIKDFEGDGSDVKVGYGISKHSTRSLEISGKIKIDEDVATLLGLFVGDGNFRKIESDNHYVFLSIPKTEYLDKKIEKIVKRLGFNNFKRINEIDVRFGSEILKILFQYVFKTGRTSTERTVPSFVFSSADNTALAFLRALYSTDGSIYYKNSKTIGIEYSTINKKLAHSLCLLLSRFGIVPDMEERERNIESINGIKLKTRPHNQFRLVINSNEQKKIFAGKIGFLQEKKQELCKQILSQSYKIGTQHHTRRLPRGLVYTAFRDLNVNVPIPIITSRNIYSWNIERELNKIPHNTPASTRLVEKVINSDIGLDEIVSIRKIPASKFVYDLEVAPRGKHIENFLGGFGSILVSNTVFSSIDLDMHIPKLFKDVPAIQLGGKVEDSVTYGDFEDEVRALFNAFLDVFMGGDYQGKPFNFPKMEVQVYPEDLKNGKFDEQMIRVSELAAKFGTPYYIINQPYMPDFACYQCCSFLMPLGDATDDSDIYNGTVRGGSLQVVTLNLPQIGYLAKDEKEIFSLIDDRIAKMKDIMLLRRDIVERNLRSGMLPFLSQKVNERGDRYLEPNKQSYTIGIVGMNELVKSHTGKEMHEDKDAWVFGLKVMKYLKEKVEQLREETGLNFALARTPAESCAYRLARIDYKKFRDRAIVQGDLKTGSIYYTNSFQIRPSAEVSLMNRLQIEGAFHPLTDGGAMSHAWLGEKYPDPEALMKLTKNIATKTALQYFAYTKDLSVCNSCGFTVGGMHKICGKCNGDDVQWWSRITGYYQNIKGWNKGKLAELKDRRRYQIS